MSKYKEKKQGRWYFGGIAASLAACVTHPLDLLKVHLQTQEKGISIIQHTVDIIRSEGILSLYSGISGSILRQLTYSTTRFGVYEAGKKSFTKKGENLSFPKAVGLAGFAGALGGLVGTPGDLVNVRMQNDIKLPLEQRRQYRHAIHGLKVVYQESGFAGLFSGASSATVRAVVMTIGQLSFYDLLKANLIQIVHLKDNISTHLLASTGAGIIATTLTQPLDVIKTRAMNAKPGENKNIVGLTIQIAKLGPLAFYKGYIPALLRLCPHTILTFVFFEQLREHFGYVDKKLRFVN